MAIIIVISVLVLGMFSSIPFQADPNGLSWCGWALLGFLAAFALSLVLKKQAPEGHTLHPGTEEAKAEGQMEDNERAALLKQTEALVDENPGKLLDDQTGGTFPEVGKSKTTNNAPGEETGEGVKSSR